eukprot:SAG31_NODE_2846_length_5008_cov_2.423508_1_plen_1358_part_10
MQDGALPCRKQLNTVPYKEIVLLLRKAGRPLRLSFGEPSQPPNATASVGESHEKHIVAIFTDEGDPGISFHLHREPPTIRAIERNGLAARQPMLQEGLELISVQGVQVAGRPYDQVLGFIRDADRPLTLAFSKPACDPAVAESKRLQDLGLNCFASLEYQKAITYFEQALSHTPDDAELQEAINFARSHIQQCATGNEVIATLHSAGPLGLGFVRKDGKVRIKNIRPESQAAACSDLKPGMLLTHVQQNPGARAQKIQGVPYSVVINLIKQAGRPITLTFVDGTSEGAQGAQGAQGALVSVQQPHEAKLNESPLSIVVQEPGPLGISFESHSKDHLPRISRIKEGSTAAREPKLVIGLILYAVDGHEIKGHEDGLNRIRNAGRPLALTFRNANDHIGATLGTSSGKTIDAAAELTASTSTDSSAKLHQGMIAVSTPPAEKFQTETSEAARVESREIQREEEDDDADCNEDKTASGPSSNLCVMIEAAGPLGLSLASDSDSGEPRIKAIKPTGSACHFPELVPGLVLHAVQEELVQSFKHAMQLLKAAGRPVSLEFRRPSVAQLLAEVRRATDESKLSDAVAHCKIALVLHPDNETMRNALLDAESLRAIVHSAVSAGTLVDTTKIAAEAAGATEAGNTHQIRSSPRTDEPEVHTPKLKTSVLVEKENRLSDRKDLHSVHPAAAQTDARMTSDEKIQDSSSATLTLTIEADGPLGLSLASDSDYGEPRIKAVRPSGSAYQFDELVPGLILFSVQGEKVESFRDGMQLLRAAGRPISLGFRRPTVDQLIFEVRKAMASMNYEDAIEHCRMALALYHSDRMLLEVLAEAESAYELLHSANSSDHIMTEHGSTVEMRRVGSGVSLTSQGSIAELPELQAQAAKVEAEAAAAMTKLGAQENDPDKFTEAIDFDITDHTWESLTNTAHAADVALEENKDIRSDHQTVTTVGDGLEHQQTVSKFKGDATASAKDQAVDDAISAGNKFLAEHQYAEAIDSYQVALHIDPGNVTVKKAIAKVAAEKSRQTQKDEFESLTYLGEACLACKQFDKALDHFNDALLLGHDTEAVTKSIDAVTKARDEEARKAFEKSRTLVSDGLYARAVNILEEALRLDSSRTDLQQELSSTKEIVEREMETLLKMGEENIIAENFPEAILQFEAALKLDPDNSDEILQAISDAKLAQSRIVQKNRMLGDACMASEEYEQAAVHFDFALRNDPTNDSIRSKLTTAQEMLRQKPQRSPPSNSVLWLKAAGEQCFASKQYQKAQEHFDDALKLDPENVELLEAVQIVGYALHKEVQQLMQESEAKVLAGDFSQALRILESAASLDPTSVGTQERYLAVQHKQAVTVTNLKKTGEGKFLSKKY